MNPLSNQAETVAQQFEQRTSTRRRAHGPVRFESESGATGEGRLVDVSEEGVRVRLDDPKADGVSEGDRVMLTPGGELAETVEPREAVIVWIDRPEPGMTLLGVRLLEPGGVSLEPLDIDRVKIDAAVALLLPAQRAMRWRVLPFAAEGDRVLIAAAEPPQPRTLTVIQRLYSLIPEIHLADADRLVAAIDNIYAGAAGEDLSALAARGASIDRGVSIDVESMAQDDNDAVALCDRLLSAAASQNASDVHLDTYESGLRVRFRVDGQIEEQRTIEPEAGAALVSRIKVISGMDIAERRAAQDGRMRHEHGSSTIDIRVASLPAKQGERLTLRLLARDADRLTLPSLGMSQMQLDLFHQAIRKPHGLILITGPTGSGKSTTLYAAIRELIQEQALNVVTIEDPVEYQIDGITQVEVDPREKVTFAKALRSTLRHDPDVVMVGEIRDAETADIAVKAALTGHLVFSTLHTNDAVGAITRLRDMGVPLYLVAATLRLVMAQRLVRRLCDRCAKPVICSPEHALALGRPDLEGQTFHEAVGCLYCRQRGYTGRLALFEALPNNPELARMIADGADERQLFEHVRSNGFARLADDAAEKLLDHRTSLAEVLRTVIQDF